MPDDVPTYSLYPARSASLFAAHVTNAVPFVGEGGDGGGGVTPPIGEGGGGDGGVVVPVCATVTVSGTVIKREMPGPDSQI